MIAKRPQQPAVLLRKIIKQFGHLALVESYWGYSLSTQTLTWPPHRKQSEVTLWAVRHWHTPAIGATTRGFRGYCTFAFKSDDWFAAIYKLQTTVTEKDARKLFHSTYVLVHRQPACIKRLQLISKEGRSSIKCLFWVYPVCYQILTLLYQAYKTLTPDVDKESNDFQCKKP